MSITKLLTVSALGGLMMACTGNSTRQEAQEDVVEARTEARQDAAEALRDHVEPADQAKSVAQINEDLAQEHKEAYEGVQDPKHAANDAHAGVHAGDGSVLAGKYERFEALEDESDEAFIRRADAAIQRVESDLTAGGTTPSEKEDYLDAKEAIASAKKSLTEARQKPDDAVFDGKVRVAVAINSAQREVSEVLEETPEND